jgi:putative glutamine amidotransferase
MTVIAIAPCGKLHDYEESVRRAGGEPWLLDSSVHTPGEVIKKAGGILLAGGEDVHPDLYGAAMHPTFSPAEQGRDVYEMELIEAAMAADLPLFAICRGIQVLNVARGGTLVQDIPTEVPDALEHRLAIPPHVAWELAHEVWIEKDSLLARITREALEGGDSCQVNSRHHQAVGRLGKGFISSATAPDGVIEAIEDPSRRFCLGVQWHPENFYRTGEFRSLFEGFVEACR